eukprot:m.857512 g.857512  ORF g.857512 m.857512 type:complete len:884 (-) comp23520_c1_seq2:167-2818(-)
MNQAFSRTAVTAASHKERARRSFNFPSRKHSDTIVCICVLSAIVIATISLSYTAYWQAKNDEQDEFDKEFENAARILIDRFVASMQQAANTGGLVSVAFKYKEITGADFTLLVGPSIESGAIHGAFRGISYNPLLDNASRPVFEELALKTDYGPGLPDGVSMPQNIHMGIWQRNSSGDVVPVPANMRYVPVYLIYPLESNQAAVGFDIHVSASRRVAIENVLTTGKAATTDIVQLVQDTRDRASCLVLSPVYNENGSSTEHIKGFIVSVVNLDGFFEDVLPEFIPGIDVVLKTSRGSTYTLHLHGSEVKHQQPGIVVGDNCATNSRTGSISLGLNWTIEVYPTQQLLDHYLTDAPMQRVLVICGCLAVLFALVVFYFIVSRRYRVAITKKFERKKQEVINFSEIVRSLKIHGVRREPREIPKGCVEFCEDNDAELGVGAFGSVKKAKLTHEEYRGVCVAVKQLLDTSSFDQEKDLASEAALMCQFAHRNVVELIGVVSKSNSLLMVMEFMNEGSLDEYLRITGPELDMRAYEKIMLDCAHGVAHIAALGVVHCDIAARNMLVSFGVVKVGDFGMSHQFADMEGRTSEDLQYFQDHDYHAKLPVRWLAPEVLRTRMFSLASDVWAMGVLLYEIWTDAQHPPYEEMNNHRVWESVLSGYRLPRPAACPAEVYSLMLECWEEDVERRCKIHHLVTQFETRIATKYDALRRSYSSESNPLDSTDTDISSDTSNPYQYSSLTRAVLLSTTAQRIREEDQTYSEVIVPSSANCEEWEQHKSQPSSDQEPCKEDHESDTLELGDGTEQRDKNPGKGMLSPLAREYRLIATDAGSSSKSTPCTQCPPTSRVENSVIERTSGRLDTSSAVLSEIAVNSTVNLSGSSCYESTV